MKVFEQEERFDLARLTPGDAGEVLTLQRAAYATEAQIYGDPFLPALTQPLAELEQELLGPALGARLGGRLVGAVSEANLRLYQREGYLLARQEPLHDGVDLVYLRKDAPASDP